MDAESSGRAWSPLRAAGWALACGLVTTGELLVLHGLSIRDRPGLPPILPDHPTRVDAYGDPLPVGAVARLGSQRFRAGRGGGGLAFLPGGKRFLAGLPDQRIGVFDIASGRRLQVVDGCRAYALEPGTGLSLRSLFPLLGDAPGLRWERLRIESIDVDLEGSWLRVTTFHRSADRRLVRAVELPELVPPIADNAGKEGGATERSVGPLPYDVTPFVPASIRASDRAVYAPGGRAHTVLRAHGGFRIRYVEDGALVHRGPLGPAAGATRLSWSPDGRQLAVLDDDGVASLWDASASRLLWSTDVAVNHQRSEGERQRGESDDAMAFLQGDEGLLFARRTRWGTSLVLLDRATGEVRDLPEDLVSACAVSRSVVLASDTRQVGVVPAVDEIPGTRGAFLPLELRSVATGDVTTRVLVGAGTARPGALEPDAPAAHVLLRDPPGALPSGEVRLDELVAQVEADGGPRRVMEFAPEVDDATTRALNDVSKWGLVEVLWDGDELDVKVAPTHAGWIARSSPPGLRRWRYRPRSHALVSPDRRFAILRADWRTFLLDLYELRVACAFPEDVWAGGPVSWHPRLPRVALCDHDGTILVWDVEELAAHAR